MLQGGSEHVQVWGTLLKVLGHRLHRFWGGWQGRGVILDLLVTLWSHSCMVTQCDSPDMAGNRRQRRLTEPYLQLQSASKN